MSHAHNSPSQGAAANPPPTGSANVSKPEDAEAARMRADIAHTRAEMDATLGELHGKLNPVVLKEQAMEQLQEVKESLGKDFKQAKATLEEELKTTLRNEVTAVITQAKTEAKAAIAEAKADVTAGISEASTALRAATVGRVENMVQDARDTVNETSNTFIDTVKQNPIPAVLAGVGIAWLIMGARSNSAARRQSRSRSGGYSSWESSRGGGAQLQSSNGGAPGNTGASSVGAAFQGVTAKVSDAAHAIERSVGGAVQKAGSLVHDAQTSMGQAGHAAGDAVGHFAHEARGAAIQAASNARIVVGHAADDVQRQGRMVERRVETYYLDNPLAVGAAVVGLGVLVGLAIPISSQEDRWMGDASDAVADQARSLAKQGLEEVDSAAQKAAQQMEKSLKGTVTGNGNGNANASGNGQAQSRATS